MPETTDIKAWYAERREDAIKHLDSGFIPLVWIHAGDIQQAYLDKDLPEPTAEEAESFLALHFDKIHDNAHADMDDFWYSITAVIDELNDQEEGA